MFKSAATKIAHNSTLPALALSGNKDLRPLQDLITAEKVVLISLQKLSVDFGKAGEALRTWGAGEGEDLGDILGASTTILAHWSAALSGYAAREHAIRDARLGAILATGDARRDAGVRPGLSQHSLSLLSHPSPRVEGLHLKSIRTREEALDELKRRRKATAAKADAAERKLNKMGPEHKNLAGQTDVLGGLREMIRGMDGEIMNEEAALGDFKRHSARALMGLKFGGLREACARGAVVAEAGLAVIQEISEEATQPGLARAMYHAHARTEARVADAERAANDVAFSALPGVPDGTLNLSLNTSGFGTASGFISTRAAGANAGLSVDTNDTGGSGTWVGGTLWRRWGDVAVAESVWRVGGGVAVWRDGVAVWGYGIAVWRAAVRRHTTAIAVRRHLDAVWRHFSAVWRYGRGGGARRPERGALADGGDGPGGGRFATFPVRSRGFSRSADEQQGAPTLAGPRTDTGGSDFMAAVLDAGVGRGSANANTNASYSSKRAEAQQQQQQQEEEPAPEYREEFTYDGRDYGVDVGANAPTTSHSQVPERAPHALAGPPPGAAAPVVGGPWLGAEEGGGDRRSAASDDVALAYMAMDDAAPHQPELYRSPSPVYQQLPPPANNAYQPPPANNAYQPPPANNAYQLPPANNAYQPPPGPQSKHVRFGNMEEEDERLPEPPFMIMKREESTSSRSRRVPPPSMSPEPAPASADDERELNAAAAREVSRELDALTFSPPESLVPAPARGGPQGQEYALPPPPPSHEYAQPPPTREYAPTPPTREYAPTPPTREYAPTPPPTTRERKPTIDPAWAEPPAEPAPFVPAHYTTPSWALAPAADAPPSPSSPRLEAPYRGLGASPANRSTSSLNTQVQVPPGARTISAAAFRRPQKAGGGPEPADTSPLALKKRLPASPYPQQRSASGLGREPQAPQQQVPPPPLPDGDDPTFDYISAYARDSQAFLEDGSPRQADFDYGRLGRVEVVGGPPTSPGYSEGRFATDLDPDGLR
ncbi:hypothetical protein B0H10DRAFT_1956780 [Mycena sp. CBHHK59/15]|nr:hypothetical protein B0H10DRAFT_1956780 [Mycena sp. CBHHK59/15]